MTLEPSEHEPKKPACLVEASGLGRYNTEGNAGPPCLQGTVGVNVNLPADVVGRAGLAVNDAHLPS